jgi:putative acetyltransferase
MDLTSISIDKIRPEDNPAVAKIVKDTLAEFGANHPGTVYYDESTNHLYEVFREPRSVYYVARFNDRILGGAGIFPSPGLPEDTCELVKMYLLPEARGLGLGKLLIEKCLDFAKESGYKNVYLETMPELKKALDVYAKFGFQYLEKQMGNTGHFGCNLWMLKKL